MQNRMNRLLRRMTVLAVVLGVGMAIAACDINDIFDVENPGSILDDDLNTTLGLNSLVVGASAEMSDVWDSQVFLIARASDELKGSGSYFETGLFRQGRLDEREMDGYWEQAHEARWAAEEAIRRFEAVKGDAAPQDTAYARAWVLGGIGHKGLGEAFCEMSYEGSGRLPRDTAFNRALNMFAEGETLASARGNQHLVTAARAGQASALAGLAAFGDGSWSTAAAMADQVPTDFVYYAYYDANDNDNVVYEETFERYEMSAFGTYAAQHPEDPRLPWVDCTVLGNCRTDLAADGQTPMYQQQIYTDFGTDIPVLSGLEARMIEAEYYMIQGDFTSFIAEINDARAHFGMDPLSAPATQQEAWDILDRERYANLWLQAKRLYDLDRWDKDNLDYTLHSGSWAYDFVYGGDDIDNTDLSRRATCLPIAYSECQANARITCND